MKQILHLLLCVGCAFGSCTSEIGYTSIIDSEDIISTNKELLLTDIIKQLEITEYFVVKNNRYELSLSEKEALDLGFSLENYRYGLSEVLRRNLEIDSMYPDGNITLKTFSRKKCNRTYAIKNDDELNKARFVGGFPLRGGQSPKYEFNDTVYSLVQYVIWPGQEIVYQVYSGKINQWEENAEGASYNYYIPVYYCPVVDGIMSFGYEIQRTTQRIMISCSTNAEIGSGYLNYGIMPANTSQTN